MTEEKRLAGMLVGLGIHLDREKLVQLIRFRDELFRWNRRFNLTAITDPDQALEKHLVDSLTILPLMGKGETLLDIGSGGGFPSIPLKIAHPDWKIWSVDSNGKKIVFQKHIVSSFGLSDFYPLHDRVENLKENKDLPSFDVITCRAFASLAATLHLAEPLLAEDGSVVVMKGPEGEKELAAFLSEETSSQWLCKEVIRLRLPLSDAARILLVFVRRKKSGDEELAGRLCRGEASQRPGGRVFFLTGTGKCGSLLQ
jgi:16S rRNA (guanine527-N7)-methyltransferase